MTSQTRSFHLGDILSVVTDRLVGPGGVDAVYDLLGYMTGDTLWTHQLPRAADEAKPEILRQHPELASVVPPEFANPVRQHVEAWVAEQVQRFGERLELEPMPPRTRVRIDPVTELRMVYPDKGILTVVDEPPRVDARAGRTPTTGLTARASYSRVAAGKTAATVEVRPHLLVDVDATGRVLGVERIGGPVDIRDLYDVLRRCRLESTRSVDGPTGATP